MNNKQNLLINSENLEKIKDNIILASEEIKEAIKNKHPVWIRHHADCDGYCAALVLEKAIQKQMYDVHTRESDFFFYYKRFPTRTPYYDYTDATKDISIMLSEAERFNRKLPLIIVVDNGSTQEDLLALKKLNLYGLKPIVIDHHPICPDVEKYLSVHINSGKSEITASMLAAEVANQIGKIENPELYAATGSIADKSEAEELDNYIKIIENNGYSLDFIKSAAQMIDFEVKSIGNSEARSYIQNLIFGDIDKMNKLIGLVQEELEKEQKIVEKIALKYLDYKKKDNYLVASIDIENTFNLKGLSNSKITSITKKKLEETENMPVAMLGYGSEIITFRINKDLDFDMNKIKEELIKEFPYSMIQGGGHAKAGSIHFSKHLAKDIKEKALEYLTLTKNKNQNVN